MRRVLAVVFLMATGCVGEPLRASGTCADNVDCEAGQACINGECLQVCNRNADCPGGRVCFAGVCTEQLAGDPPDITTVSGNGNTPDRFYDTIFIAGTRLTDAEFRLETTGAVWGLVPEPGANDSFVTVRLPVDLIAGDHTLSATNQSGTDQMMVSLLAEPRTAAELLTMIATVDGTGSGLDADLVDGVEIGTALLPDCNGTTDGIAKWDDTGDTWMCGTDQTGGGSVGTTLDDLGVCANGDVPESDGAGGWSCVAPSPSPSPTLSELMGCASGDVPQSNGSGGWTCGTAVSRTMSIPATAFLPIDSADGWVSDSSSGTAREAPGGVLMAAMRFPDGATVTRLFCRIEDDSTTRYVRVQLRRTTPGCCHQIMAELSSAPVSTQLVGGFAGDLTDTTITDSLINNNSFYYNLIYETLTSADVRAGCGMANTDDCFVGFCEVDYTVDQPYP